MVAMREGLRQGREHRAMNKGVLMGLLKLRRLSKGFIEKNGCGCPGRVLETWAVEMLARPKGGVAARKSPRHQVRCFR